MTSLVNSAIGILFLLTAATLTFLMYYIWKFPFDNKRLRSSAPRSLVLLHRILGYLYVIIYIYLMWQMIPRLWAYQIELPARTVIHLSLGVTIGAILMAKLTIVRFFKHMEVTLVPLLGTALFICTCLLISLVLPFSLREAYLRDSALGGDAMTAERINRVREQLPRLGITDINLINRLSSLKGLLEGRRVLMTKCVQCHDLRTVLARPRTPKIWQQTVSRMADRSTVLNPISDIDQGHVTAYLIAISPTLQQTLKQRRKMELQATETQTAMNNSAAKFKRSRATVEYDSVLAKATFEKTCSQCHSHTQIEEAPPATYDEVIALVQRMVSNGLSASDTDLEMIMRYLTEIYADDMPAMPEAPEDSAEKKQ